MLKNIEASLLKSEKFKELCKSTNTACAQINDDYTKTLSEEFKFHPKACSVLVFDKNGERLACFWAESSSGLGCTDEAVETFAERLTIKIREVLKRDISTEELKKRWDKDIKDVCNFTGYLARVMESNSAITTRSPVYTLCDEIIKNEKEYPDDAVKFAKIITTIYSMSLKPEEIEHVRITGLELMRDYPNAWNEFVLAPFYFYILSYGQKFDISSKTEQFIATIKKSTEHIEKDKLIHVDNIIKMLKSTTDKYLYSVKGRNDYYIKKYGDSFKSQIGLNYAILGDAENTVKYLSGADLKQGNIKEIIAEAREKLKEKQ